jgi:5'-nucleotidase
MREPLRVQQFAWDGCEAMEVSGFPVDCVNVGLTIGYPDGCDLVLSGINNGPNLGFDITYSGTVAGAMEGTINGIPSISISMAAFVYGAPSHFDTAKRWLREHWSMLVEAPQTPLTFLNVNIPAIEYVELRGHRVVPMGRRVYRDRVELRTDPWGRPYYWQGGVAVLEASDQPGTDVAAVSDGFVSITPVTLDWTNYEHLKDLEARFASARA